MDHKSWPWKKKSSKKTIIETDKVDGICLPGIEEEFQKLQAEKAELENNLKNISENPSLVLAENEAKDELLKKHESAAQEAVVGWDKTEVAATMFKKKLDEALIEKVKSDERITHLDDALKDCMEKLRFVQEEQGQKIHDAVTKSSKEYEKHTMVLEMKLAETSKMLAVSDAENANLSMALLAKDKTVERLNKQMAQAETDISALMARLKSKENNNASLKYEIQVLERQLEIQNEEREVNRQASEASHKRHLENVRKLAELETECQRLRLLVRKRLPSPAALAKMKTEMKVMGRDSTEMRRMLNASSDGMTTGFERINNLSEQLRPMEEENKNLREALDKKIDELKFSRNVYSWTASKLLEAEASLKESSYSHTIKETTGSSNAPHEAYVSSISDFDNEDKVSCTESWSSALISEFVQFNNKNQNRLVTFKDAGASEMTLMDDFVEMEKLASVWDDNLPCSSPVCSAEIGPSHFGSSKSALKVTCKGITPVSDCLFSSSDYGPEVASASLTQSKTYMNPSEPSERSTLVDTSRRDPNAEGSLQSDLSESICKVIELVEGINLQLPVDVVPEMPFFKDERHLSHKKLGTPSDYMVRVFQWKATNLSEVLQRFLRVCYDLLDGKADINKFAQELSSAMDWVVNHCFSLQDVSSMREEMKKQFEWDEPRSETESEVEVIGQLSDRDGHYSSLSTAVASNRDDYLFQKEKVERHMEDDNNPKSRDEVRNEVAENIYFKGMLQPTTAMFNQNQECEKNFTYLQNELKTLKKSRVLVGDGVETQKLVGNIFGQPALAASKSNEAQPKYSAIKTDLENQTSHYKEVESMCQNKRLPKSFIEQEVPSSVVKQEEKQPLQTEREITAASEKLAECQETILHIGKQLSALSNMKRSAHLDKVTLSDTNKANTPIITTVTNPTNASAKRALSSQRSSLLDRMMAEDSAENPKRGTSFKADGQKENPSSTVISNDIIDALEHILLSDIARNQDVARAGSFSIVPRKKGGIRSLWKKLLWKKRKWKQET